MFGLLNFHNCGTRWELVALYPRSFIYGGRRVVFRIEITKECPEGVLVRGQRVSSLVELLRGNLTAREKGSSEQGQEVEDKERLSTRLLNGHSFVGRVKDENLTLIQFCELKVLWY